METGRGCSFLDDVIEHILIVASGRTGHISYPEEIQL